MEEIVQQNIEVVRTICALLDELAPRKDNRSYSEQITYVTDRPGHDLRYAIDASKAERVLGWKSKTLFANGIAHTVKWYLTHMDWMRECMVN